VLAYRNGGSGLIQLTWFDRQGKNLGPAGEPSLLSEGVLSPDGGRIAASGVKDGNQDIWLMDLARSANTRLTFAPGVDVAPVWSPDGSRVAYASAGKSSFEIHERLANGTGEERTILAADQDLFPQAWSKDGRYLLYAARSTNIELMVLPMEGDRKPFAFAPSMFITSQGRFSPDGRWVAYVSNESGRAEVYVQPFPPNRDGGGKWMVSSTGGVQPLWRLDGKELFYLSPNNQAMAVAVESGPGFKAGIPKFLFSAQALTNLGVNNLLRAWEVTPDGQKFLISTSQGATNSSPMTVVINWQAGLKK
jgi:eukaryotic-like serine/threonine-protein kinase